MFASVLEKISHTLKIYIYVQSMGYRLKLCSTVYENAPTCSISMRTSSSAMAEKPRDACDFKEVGHFQAKF